MTGAELITAERQRQVEVEGWTPEHDDGHDKGELATTAAELVAHGTGLVLLYMPDDEADAWGLIRKHASDRIRQLEIAGALIAAEIDRLQRAGEFSGEKET